MSLKRIGVLLGREIIQGPKGVLFIMAIAAPIILSLVVSLVFGTLFNDTPRMGIVDEGDSRLLAIADEYHSVITVEYKTDAELREAVESGVVDVGMVLPPDFDNAVTRGLEADVTAYIWGEGRIEDFGILEINVFGMLQQLAGRETPVNIETITLGEGAGIPWNERLLPFIVIMAVVLASVMLPAMAVVNEKEKQTLTALAVTPTTLGEIFISKGVIGAVLSLFMGVFILVLNQAFGLHPLLLVMVLGLGAVMGTILGLTGGALLKDTNSLLALYKIAGILLYAPALVYMFPQIPEWVGKIFPTYYVIQPIIQISQQGSGWADIATNVFILIGLDLALIAVLMLTLSRTKQYAT